MSPSGRNSSPLPFVCKPPMFNFGEHPANLSTPYYSCYSAYEHSSLIARLPRTSGSTSAANPTLPSLPPDISLETIVSVFLICVGLVVGAEKLQPISWRVWAGKAERESGGGPFQGLEDRLGFFDIRVSARSWSLQYILSLKTVLVLQSPSGKVASKR